MTEHHQWLLTNPKEALANACHIASAAVRADILRAEPTARLCRSAGGYVPLVHLGGGRYRADMSGTTMAFAAVLRGERLVFASLGDSPLLLTLTLTLALTLILTLTRWQRQRRRNADGRSGAADAPPLSRRPSPYEW